MKRLIAVFLIASLIAGCGKQRQNGIKSGTAVNIIVKEVNPEPTSSPSPIPNMKDLPALLEPVEETKLKIPWAKVIITTVALAFLWGFVQENKETLRDRISRLGFWSDVYWTDFKERLKHGYYWLCLNGPGVHSWLPEPKNDPEFDEYKMTKWLSRPVQPTVIYSSQPYVNEYWWDPKPKPTEEEVAERVTRDMQTAGRNIQAISKWVKWQEIEEKQALAESVELPPEPLNRPKKPSDDLRFEDLFGNDERVYDNEEVKLQRMQELLTEIDATLGWIEIKCDSLRNWRLLEIVPVEPDFDFFD
ncbi:MAG: hypothetical protein LE169_01635 [Endomicrobium sp.]|nr:hypothetical protein [Endomicrobium sp.]